VRGIACTLQRSAKMQLERIRVEGLFGRFDHDIAFRRPEKITIIHAPNGFGKTVVLTLVNAFFSRQFWSFYKYRFQRLILYFDSNENVEIRNEGPPDLFSEKGKEKREVFITLNSPTGPIEPFRLNVIEGFSQLDRFVPVLEPAGADAWFDQNIGDVITTNEAIERYSAHLPAQFRKAALELPPWLSEIVDSSDCRLIETQRLLRIIGPADAGRMHRRSYANPRPVVEVEARDLATRIGRTLAEYANRAQTLDQSFPRRVIDALGSGDALQPEEVSARLRTVEQKRSALIEAGLLDKTGAPEILSQAELLGQEVRQVIGVYLSDVERKFSRFDELFERVSLFKEIISEKFQFKSV